MSKHETTPPAFDLTDFNLTVEQSGANPELSLLVAVLQRAVIDFRDPAIRGDIRLDARRWFYSQSQEPMSFLWLCEMLSDHPGDLRRKILKSLTHPPTNQKRVICRVETR